MLRTFSQLFAGPAEQDCKLPGKGPPEEASTAAGSSSEGASDGASLPTDDASDISVEESPPIHSFHDLTEAAPGAADPGIDNECAEDRGGWVVDPQSPACAQAPQDDAEAPDTDPAPWPAADRACAADGPASDARARRAPPSRLPQARRGRAAKQKYAQSPDGTYSKARAVCEWDYDSNGGLKQFATEEALLEHERSCQERRQCGEHPAKYETLSAESQALVHVMNACAEEQHEATRTEIHASKDEVIREL